MNAINLIQGDCVIELAKLEAESVDLIATDPPYFLVNKSGSGFMGKQWDSSKNPYLFHLKWAKEALRVLKPGAFAFVMCAPRQDCQLTLVSGLHDAGFKINYSSMTWCFASGFPKATNMGKAVDKKLGVESTDIGPNPNKMGRHEDMRGGNYGAHVTTAEMANDRVRLTVPSSPEGNALDGSYAGFQVKPSVEVIIVAMKPLNHKTYVDHALDWVSQRMAVLREIESQLKEQGVEKVEWQD